MKAKHMTQAEAEKATAKPDTEATPADITTGIRAELATIRRWWPGTANPPRRPGVQVRSPATSRLPGNAEAISLRAEVTLDLAFWVHALLDEHPVTCAPVQTVRVPEPTLTYTTTWADIEIPGRLDCTDVPAMCDYLDRHAGVIAEWASHGHRLWAELADHARDVTQLAKPRARETMPLGECDECGEIVRAKAHDPGNIRCKGCGTTDTFDGWILRIVGHEGLVTAEQLVGVLRRRMGIATTRNTIRTWVKRGVIHPSGTDEHGRAVFDRYAVFKALAGRKEESA